jgi:protein-S-isoprenylcysteine O-methyltransferase Ste14
MKLILVLFYFVKFSFAYQEEEKYYEDEYEEEYE